MAPISYFYVCLAALFTSLIMIPPVSKMAVRIGGMDCRDARKLHDREVPRLAGVAIFFAFLLAFIVFIPWRQQSLGFAFGALIIFLTGLIDDLITLSPRQKFLGEGLAALAAVLIGGIRLDSLGNVLGTGELALGALAIPFSVIAIVGIMNSINLLDGLDGLAGGVTAICTVAFGVLAYKSGNVWLLGMSAALVGALFGFLKYNTYPARVFMGDCGSLFLGYCMGIFAISLINGSAGRYSEMTSFIILAVPILDTLFVMFNRVRNGKGVFSPDRTHIHHRLLNTGMQHKSAVVTVYCLSQMASVMALFTRKLPDFALATTLLVGAPALYIAFRMLMATLMRHGIHTRRIIPSLWEARTRACRRAVYLSRYLRATIKYLTILVLLMSALIPAQKGLVSPSIAAILLALSLILLLITGDYCNRFLVFTLYFVGGFLVFSLDNVARNEVFLGVRVVLFSHAIFLVLFVLEGLEVLLRRKKGMLVSSGLEYLILLMVLTVPFLPQAMLSQYHLLTVVGKSIILFIAYKMTLTRRATASRSLVVVTQLALLAYMVQVETVCLLVLLGYGVKVGFLEQREKWQRVLHFRPLRPYRMQLVRWQRRSAAVWHPEAIYRVLWWFQLQDGEFDTIAERHGAGSGTPAPAGPMWQKRYPVNYRSSR
ncbi:undecaprenyl/decaprenyl-phosphate alpha-N-acetylglucosaminyl 1-phosphate transferase [Geomonas sp. RF6]|uniref:MraY family glycosyltransferase n=1 Tax=Geomonas sp. RF6 TaxID=2897342 RepID=UPI001E3F8A39|nr:MraY family glycosyltransferase [Geomonas sp. RF6]UFS70069.1 undecaprenyl/decaprenyl-phosphate alpha-N-acetylglucosaminyl 1-phosphate transferase [Geomonas sp. RF6]